MEESLLARTHELLQKTSGFVSITFASCQLKVSWPVAKMLLLRLMAEGKVEGQEVKHRGWIFRAKKPQSAEVVVTDAA